MKFSTKLMLALSGTVIAGAVVMAAITGSRTGKVLEHQLIARLEDNANRMLEKLDQLLGEHGHRLKLLTRDPGFIKATASAEQTTRRLQEFLRWHPKYHSAAFLTMDRVRVAETAGAGIGAREDADDCWAGLAAGEDLAICIKRASPEAGPSIHLAAVVRDGRDARGVVVLRLPVQTLAVLGEASGAHSPGLDLHVDLVDRKGVLLYSSHEKEGVLHGISPDWDFIREKVDAGQVSGSLKFTNPAEDSEEEILVWSGDRELPDKPESGWTLILFVPIHELFAPIRELRQWTALAVLAIGAVFLGILFLFVRSFTRPIEALDRAARQIGKGNLEVRIPVGTRDELGHLAQTFNQMAVEMSASHDKLAAHAGELERRIEERTEELLRANTQLQAELSERMRAQEALEIRTRMLRMNVDIGEALTSGEALAAVLQRCAGHMVRDLEAAFVRIWTPGSEPGILELRASAGEHTRLDGRHSRKVVGELKIGIIAKEQRPLLTNAVIGDPDFTDQAWARQAGMVAFAGSPLIVDGRTVGVMALFSRQRLEPFVLTALENVAIRVGAYIGRKQAEEALRVSEMRYRDLFDMSTDGVYKVNAEGLFSSMNAAGARIFGYENPAEIIGRPALDYWRDPADRERFRGELAREKSVSAYRIGAKKKSGEHLELESSSRILEGDDGAFLGIEGVLRDVTERVKAEAERDLLLAQLQEAAANIKTLSGLLPICAGCKKIRDDKGSWNQIERYISSHSEAEFSHGLCPDCQKVYFPGVTGKS